MCDQRDGTWCIVDLLFSEWLRPASPLADRPLLLKAPQETRRVTPGQYETGLPHGDESTMTQVLRGPMFKATAHASAARSLGRGRPPTSISSQGAPRPWMCTRGRERGSRPAAASLAIANRLAISPLVAFGLPARGSGSGGRYSGPDAAPGIAPNAGYASTLGHPPRYCRDWSLLRARSRTPPHFHSQPPYRLAGRLPQQIRS